MKSFLENIRNKTTFAFETAGFASLLLFLLPGNELGAQEQSLPAIHISSESRTETAQPKNSSGSTHSYSNVQPQAMEAAATPSLGSEASTSDAQTNSAAQTPSTSESKPAAEQTIYEIPVETASFNGITPGKTTLDELHKSFGEPARIQKDGAGKGIDVEEYQIEGFKGVAFHIINQTVYGIIAELAQTINARQLAGDLGMAHIQSVFMVDEKGTIKGEIFPEIGVALAYDPSQKLGNVEQMTQSPESIPMNVLQIIFQTVSADPFLLRAETWVDVDPKRAYGDIQQALKLEPENEKALAYLKVLEEAVPELKNGGTPIPPGTSTPETNSSSQIAQSSPNAPELNAPQDPLASQTASQENASLTELDPPDLDSLEGNGTENTSAQLNTLEKLEQQAVLPSEPAAAPLPGSAGIEENELPSALAPPELPGDLTDAPSLPDAMPKEEPLPNSLQELSEENQNSEPQEESLPDTVSSAGLQDGSLRADPNQKQTALDMPNDLLKEFNSLESKSESPAEEIPTTLSFENELFEKVEYLAKNQNQEQALELLVEIRKKFLDNPFVSFRANLVEGDILVLEETPNIEQAFLCHRRAAEQGKKLLEAGKVIRGRMYPLTDSEKLTVQELLLNAQLGIAGDIAAGPWEPKVQNTRKWLNEAQLLMNEIFKAQETRQPKAAHRLRYEAQFRTLTILCSLGKEADVSECVKTFLEVNLTILKQAKSSQEYADICMKSALILDDASQICVLRNEMENAQRCLNRAIAMMEQIEENKKRTKKELSINESFLFSQLYYHKGMIFSLMAGSENGLKEMTLAEQNEKKEALHQEAVTWYDKSIPYLMNVIKKKEWKDLLQLGKIVNGMSISYTETGDMKKAYVLLKTAIFCLEQHVEAHPEDKNQLKTPYQNMIQLLEFMGKKEEMEEIRQKLKGVSF